MGYRRFFETSRAVFDPEEGIYIPESVYNLFSMLTLAFIQLGIIVNNEHVVTTTAEYIAE